MAAQLVTHIPNKGGQMVRYYGSCSNKSRGMRKKAGSDNQVPALVESTLSSTVFRKNRAQLIPTLYKIWGLQPTFPKENTKVSKTGKK